MKRIHGVITKKHLAIVRVSGIVIILLTNAGCATVFKGYVSEVTISNAPEKLQLYTVDNVEIPTAAGTKEVIIGYGEVGPIVQNQPDPTKKVIRLRSNRDHPLILKDSASEYYYYAVSKIDGWWFVLDMVCGVLPAFIDMYTGNWNSFDDIDCTILQPARRRENKNN